MSIQLMFCSLTAIGQVDEHAVRYAGTITERELRDHLVILASDAFLGRDTGKEGQKMAAAYLKEQFQGMGVPPVPAPDPTSIVDGYFQRFPLIEERSGTISIETESDTLVFMKEILYFQEALSADRSVNVVMLGGDGTSLEKFKGRPEAALLVIPPAQEPTTLLSSLRPIAEKAGRAGSEVVIVAIKDWKPLLDLAQHFATGSRVRLAEEAPSASKSTTPQVILMDARIAEGLLGKGPLEKLARKRPGSTVARSMILRKRPQETRLYSENVLAFIEGSDKKEEVVVITAHYDHIGVEDGVVFNGADDDGTGTVALLEIAEALSHAKAEGHGPRRSVLIMPVSGEEKGLLGSRYYSEHPVFPLESTVADLNIDMIGRFDSTHATSAPYVYVIGSDRLSTELHTLNERANSTYSHLELDYTFNAESDPNRFYYRSDHYNFARKGVPSIFYFSGVHEDYHQPGDDVEKIRFDLLHQRTLLVFHTAWLLANQEQRIAVDKPVK